MTETASRLCECCRHEMGTGCISVLEPHTLNSPSATLPAEFLVIIQRGSDRWWEIAWRDPATGLIDGPWRYTADLHGAEPIAWCSLPPITLASQRSG